MNRSDYFKKLQHTIDEGIQNGVYIVTEDRTLADLKLLRSFLYGNFKKYEHYEKMLPTSNQPGQLYGTAKTHKFGNIADITVDNLKFCPIIAQSGTYTYNAVQVIANIADITVDNLKFCPIIAQSGTYTYNAVQVIANYLKPLCSNNDYIIRNTQGFAKIIREQDPLKFNEQYVSYDVESLFTNVPVHETIETIINEIYVENKLPKLCSKLIFKRLLLKLTTEYFYARFKILQTSRWMFHGRTTLCNIF